MPSSLSRLAPNIEVQASPNLFGPLPLKPISPKKEWTGGASLPSSVASRSSIRHLAWKTYEILLNLFFWITGINLILPFCPRLSSWIDKNLFLKFEYGLFEDVVLSSSHRYLMGAKEHVLFDYLHQFFKREKAPESLLKELKQASNWSRRFEEMEGSWSFEKRHTRLDALTKEMSKEIKNLKKGEAVLIPSGISSEKPGDERGKAFYRVIKTEDSYRLEICSRSPFISSEERLVHGKVKTFGKVCYHSINEEEITDPYFWHSLLALQFYSSVDDTVDPGFLQKVGNFTLSLLPEPFNSLVKKMALSPGSLETRREVLKKLLAPFEDRKEQPHKTENQEFHAPRFMCRVQNIWSLFHGTDDDKREVARSKLRLHLETLFRYFDSVHMDLKKGPLHRFYLREGIQELSQTLIELKNQEILSSEDVSSIETEFFIIEKEIQKAEKNPKTPKNLYFTTPTKAFTLQSGLLSPLDSPTGETSLPKLGSKPVRPETSHKREAFPLKETKTHFDLKKANTDWEKGIPSFSKETLVQDLKEFVLRCTQEEPSILLEKRLVDTVLYQLPFLVPEEEGTISPSFISHYLNSSSDPLEKHWSSLSSEEKLACLRLLTTLHQKIVSLSLETSHIFPDRLFALIKLGAIAEHLARSDEQNSGFTHKWYIPNSKRLLENLADHRFPKKLRNRSNILFSPAKDLKRWFSWESHQESIWESKEENKGKYPTDLRWKNGKDERPNTPHIQSLLEIDLSLRQILGIPEEKEAPYNYTVSETIQENWGLGIEHPDLQEVFQRFSLSGYSSPTEEAIMHRPEKALRNLDDEPSWVVERRTKAPPFESPDSDLQEFLLSLQEDLSLENILGLIKTKSHLLKVQDFRATLERFFVDHEIVQKNLSHNKGFPEFLKEEATAILQTLWQRKEFDQAIFACRLFQTLENEHKEFEGLNLSVFILERLEESFIPNSETAHLKHALISEYFFSLEKKENLSSQEIKDFIYYSFFLRNLPFEISLFDPVLNDRIEFKTSVRVLSLLETLRVEEISPILDAICIQEGISLPKESWEKGEEAGVFHAGSVSINVLRGALNDEKIWSLLPMEVLRSPTFRKLIPTKHLRGQPHAKGFTIEKGRAYGFLDSFGTEWRIEQKKTKDSSKTETYFYKKVKDAWLQYISLKDLGIQEKDAFFPKPFLALDSFVPVEKPTEVWLFQGNEPQFKAHLTTSWIPFRKQTRYLSSIDDLRKGENRLSKAKLSCLSFSNHPSLFPFLRIENGKEIFVWTQDDQVKEIELLRHNLRFKFEEGKFLCISPPFKGFSVSQEASLEGIKGLPAALTLLPSPSSTSKKKTVLLPKFGGEFFDTFPSMMIPLLDLSSSTKKVLFRVAEAFKDRLDDGPQALLQSLSGSPHTPKYLWQIDPIQSQGYWVFEIEDSSEVWKPEKSLEAPALFDAFLFSLYETQVENLHAIPRAKKFLNQLKTLSFRELDEAYFDGWIEKIKASLQSSITLSPRPETVGLALIGLLLLEEKAPAKKVESIKKEIEEIYKLYLSQGKHKNENALLEKEEKEKLQKILGYDVEKLQDAQISMRKEISKQASPPSLLQKVSPLASLNYSQLEIKTSNALRGLPFCNSFYFTQNPTVLAAQFPSVYKIVQSSPKKEDFQKLKWTLNTLAKTSPITDFLEMLVTLKERNPGLYLPDFPDISQDLKKREKKEDWDKYRERERRGEKSIEAFFKQTLSPILDPIIESSKKEALSQEAPGSLSSEKEEIPSQKTLKIPENIEESPFWHFLEAHLEEYESSSGFTLSSSKEAEQIASKKQVDSYFELLESKFPSLRVSNFGDPSAQIEKEKLEREINTLSKEKTQRRLTKEGQNKVLEILCAKSETLKKAYEQEKTALEKLLANSKKEHSFAERLGGYEKVPTFEGLKTAFIQKELATFALKLKGVTEEDLLKGLTAYYQAKTLYQHAEFVILEFFAARRENLLDSIETAEKLYSHITAKREYDPNEFPALLSLEDALGFLMNEKQVRMVQEILSKPNSVCQAVTGAGKSSVIMPLLGLLKANGKNLVLLKFLNPLFSSNASHLNEVLSRNLKQKIFELRFSTNEPIVFEVTNRGKVSVFERMYEDLLRTLQEKGCVVTDKKSLPLLEAKYVALLYKCSIANASSEQIKPIDAQHLLFLTRILKLVRERGEAIYDEHDKALYPRDELHLAVGPSESPPPFMIEIINMVVRKIAENEASGLKKNTQGEIPENIREKVLKETASEIASFWSKSSPFSKEELEGYFTGENNDLSSQILEDLEEETQDKLALTKDLFLTYLPLTLSQTADRKYTLSQDGMNVIPCEYANVPREGSHFDNIVERLTYSIQYFYQKGIPRKFLKRWVENLQKNAIQEMNEKRLKSISETEANRLFERRFKITLPLVVEEGDYKKWEEDILKDHNVLASFIEEVLHEISLQKEKVSMDSQNQVSMSKAAAGISATEGCKEGLHPRFETTDLESIERADMVTRLLKKTEKSQIFTFDAESSEHIVDQLKAQGAKPSVLIDGAGVILGSTPQETAKKLLEERQDLDSVGYFNNQGVLETIGKKEGNLGRYGQYYPHAQSRGADVKLSPSTQAVLLWNGKDSLEVLLQTTGRLRHPDHALCIAVSKQSELKTLKDILEKALETQATQNSDNLYRSEIQKMKDSLRREMLDGLLENDLLEGGEIAFHQMIGQFTHYQKTLPLFVAQKVEGLDDPGAYFANHGEVQKKDKSPIIALKEAKKDFLEKANKLGLSAEWLKTYNPEVIRDSLPRVVWNNAALSLGQEAEVEVEQQVEIQTKVVVEEEQENFTYLHWVDHWSCFFEVHGHDSEALPETIRASFSKKLKFTENFLPLHRKKWKADKAHWRVPHDARQSRLHYILIDGRLGNKSLPFSVTALDEVDTRWAYSVSVYDTRLRRFIALESTYSSSPPKNEESFLKELVQLKFWDGQIRSTDYSTKEWEELENWIKPLALKEKEALYAFMKDDVLSHKKQDQAQFPYTEIGKLLQGEEISSQKTKQKASSHQTNGRFNSAEEEDLSPQTEDECKTS